MLVLSLSIENREETLIRKARGHLGASSRCDAVAANPCAELRFKFGLPDDVSEALRMGSPQSVDARQDAGPRPVPAADAWGRANRVVSTGFHALHAATLSRVL